MPDQDLFQACSSIKRGESLAAVLHSVQQMQELETNFDFVLILI